LDGLGGGLAGKSLHRIWKGSEGMEGWVADEGLQGDVFVLHVSFGFGPPFGFKHQICPGLNANEIQIIYGKNHKVSSLVKGHHNTHNSVKYEVTWTCKITLPNMKY